MGGTLYVTAGPGSGKTETVSARIQYLLDEEGLSGQEVLVISFSRAAVEADPASATPERFALVGVGDHDRQPRVANAHRMRASTSPGSDSTHGSEG